MKKFYFLVLAFLFNFIFSQNSEIKMFGGASLQSPNYYCPAATFNLEVNDYFSNSTSTITTLPLSVFNSIISSATGETNVLFNAAFTVTDKFSYPIDLDFNFKFFNKTYTRVVVGSNGRLVFTNDAILDNLNDTATYFDRTFSGNRLSTPQEPGVPLPSIQYNEIYKTGDITREIKMAQIFAGFTKLRVNSSTGGYKYKKFDDPVNGKGILITFQSVIPNDGFGAVLGSIYTSRIILFEDGRIVLNVQNKTAGNYNAILGMQNEDGTDMIIPGPPTNNNGHWSGESSDAYVVTTGLVRTPTYLWELDRNNDGTIEQISNTRFFTSYSPVSDIEKLSVKITFLEPSNLPITSSIIFRKVRVPVVEKNIFGCTITLKVNSASFDSGLTYKWFRHGDPTVITSATNGELVLNSTSVPDDYYAVPTRLDGTDCTASNKITIKKFFPAIIKSQLTLCDNSSTPAFSKFINLYSEFCPQYIPGSAFEEYEIEFFENGVLIPNPTNYEVFKNKDISLIIQKKLKGQPTYCPPSDVVKVNYIAIPNTINILVCSSATTFDLKNYFATNFPALLYNITFNYSDGSSAGNGSTIDVSRIVNVNTTITGASCSTNSQVSFTPGSSISVNAVPIQERCSGLDTIANRFNFNDIKLILDPINQYDVKFFYSDNTEIIPNVVSPSGANLDLADNFWTNTQGDFIIHAKAFSKVDPTCFGISPDIILRVSLRPTTQSNYQDFLKKPACGVSKVNLTINNIFDLVNTNAHNQIPTLKYFDENGVEVIGIEISQYPISRGIPYVEIQNGACLPPLKLDFVIVNMPFSLMNPSDEIVCDDSYENSDGILKINIASDVFKQKFTTNYQNTTFEYYDGSVLIYTSNTSNDTFNYDISNNKIIRVKVWNSSFCPSESTLKYFVNTSNTIQFSGNTDLCFEENLSFSILNLSDFNSVKLISPDLTETKITGDHTINYSDVQFGKIYKIQAENSLGCLSETSFTPSDENQPKIQVINQTNNSIEVIAEGGVKPYRYYFNGIPQTSNILLNPTASSYVIQVESSTGCIGPPKAVYFIKINNSFTPNADGINDVWKIDNLNQMEKVSIVIVDRNGTKVFESVNSNKVEWDGKHNNRTLPTSTYWYSVSWYDPVSLKSEQRQGWILMKNRN